MKAKGKARRRLAIPKRTRDLICREVALGRSLRKVLRAPGMPKMGTLMDYLEKDVSFAEQYARARRRGIELHIDGIVDLADTANARNAQAVRLRVDVRKWLASKLVPKVYGDRLDLEGISTPFSGERLGTMDAARRVAYILHEGIRQQRAAGEHMRAEAERLATRALPGPGGVVDAEEVAPATRSRKDPE